MSTLQVLLPPLPQAGGESDFARWLARGDRLSDLPDPRTAVARESFRFAGDTMPVAALRHHVHGSDAGGDAWICVDPAYVRSEATGARLMAWPLADLSGEEARALSTTLMPLFGEAGLALTVDTPAAWCAQLRDGAPDVVLTRPGDALGADLLDCLPQGDPGRPWRRLFNEAQVALHTHPVNATRIASGKLPVNALRFWGAGRLPESVESRVGLLASSDDVLRGLASLSGIVCAAPSPEVLDAYGETRDALLDLDIRGVGDVGARWLACFRQVLRDRRFDAIELRFPGGERFRVRYAHRLRFWRRG
jgi:hypothetical protein